MLDVPGMVIWDAGDGGVGGGGGGGGGGGEGVQYALLMPEEPPDLSAWRQNE